ncbi:MAG: hypothetical protein GWO02_07255 [Gammaproteobacteria bacterium]|nr:hypothetical protein [Gammaproteobacteria bacterium]
MTVIQLPTSGLTLIDIRVVKVVAAALGWSIEVARNERKEAFAMLASCYDGDAVFILCKERGDYVLTEVPAYGDAPRQAARGSLEAVLAALPRSLAALI